METEEDLKNWLLLKGSDNRLLALHAVGEKTVDFLKILLRIPTNALDRNLNSFLAAAGIDASGYKETHDIIDWAADIRRQKPPCASKPEV